jgi:hypothetical protein
VLLSSAAQAAGARRTGTGRDGFAAATYRLGPESAIDVSFDATIEKLFHKAGAAGK